MEQEVYIDLYFLVNFSMDLLCMMTVARLLHYPIRRWRAVLAAALGGVWAALSLLVGCEGPLGIAADLAVAALMCTVGFASRGGRPTLILRATAAQFLCSVLLGGIMTALYAALNRLQLPWDALQGDGLSVWSFALLTAVAGLATLRGGRALGAAHRTRSVLLEVELFGGSVRLRGMVDSGNLLRDPISGRGVVIADPQKLLRLLPDPLRRAAGQSDPLLWLQSTEYAAHVRLIPVHTATGDALLPALIPTRMVIVGEAGCRTPTDYLIAVSPLGDRAQGFDALLPAD